MQLYIYGMIPRARFYGVAVVLLLSFLSQGSLRAQVGPGVILRACTDTVTGRSILNPNHATVSKTFNGVTYRYASKTNLGWIMGGDDTSWTANDIRWRPVPSPCGEPCCDLRRGPDHRFSDIVYDAQGVGVYMFYDSVRSAVLFRFRMGSLIPGAKGYSLLLDTDLRWGASGSQADAGYVPKTTGINGNPGYELEIVLETGFGVAVYNVNGVGNPSDNIQQTRRIWYSGANLTPAKNWTDMSQVVLAATTENGDPDYFLDFYLPASVLTGSGFFPEGINQPIRIVPTTVMAPKPSIAGPVSDLYGCDDSTTTAWQPPVRIGRNEISGLCTPAPPLNTISLTSPTATTATVSGTWTPDTKGSRAATIFIYRNNDTATAIASVSVSSGNGGSVAWSTTISAAAAGQIITAKARGTHAYESRWCFTSNSRTIRSCVAGTVPAIGISCLAKNGINGTGFIGGTGSTITIRRISSTGTTDIISAAPTSPLANSGLTFNPATSEWQYNGGCQSGNSNLLPGTYEVFQTNAAGCASSSIFSGITTSAQGASMGTTMTPTISSPTGTTIPTTTTAISGSWTVAASQGVPAIIRVYRDENYLGNATISGSSWTFSLSGITLSAGETFQVRAQAANTASLNYCTSDITRSVVAAPCSNAAPSLNVDSATGQLAPGSLISGTATPGATVRVFNALHTQVDQVTANAGGAWSTSYAVRASGDGAHYYATVTTGCANAATSGNYTIATVNTGSQYCGGATSFSVDASSGGSYTSVYDTNGNPVLVNQNGTMQQQPFYSDAQWIRGSFPTGVSTSSTTRVNFYVNGSVVNSITLSAGATSWGPVHVAGLLFAGAELTIAVVESGKTEYVCSSQKIICACALSNTPAKPVISSNSVTSVMSGQRAKIIITNPENNRFYRLYARSTKQPISEGVWYNTSMGSAIIGGRMLSSSDSLTINTYTITSSDIADAEVVANSESESCSETTARSITFLPITLLDFRGTREGKANVLRWESVEEVNADYFELQRSANGTDFTALTRMAVQGPRSRYRFNDSGSLRGDNFYRLRMVDLDGQFRYSRVIVLRSNAPESEQLNAVRPNPFRDRLICPVQLPAGGKVQAQLRDAAGRLVALREWQPGAGQHELTLEGLGSLPAGLYLLELHTGSTVLLRQWVQHRP